MLADSLKMTLMLIFFCSPSSRVPSVESFVSAVEEPDDLIRFEDDSLSPPHFVITSPSLVYKYSQHLGQLECLNWNSPLMIRPEQRVFSINNNLKVTFYKPIIDSSKPEEGTNSPHTKAFLIVFLYVWTGRISSRIGHFCPSIRGLTAR